MTPISNNDLFLKACRKEPTPRTPIWIMRQAGRYLPEYRALREKHDFFSLCKTPELAARVTLLPIDILDVDAAIIFSDIMVIPEAMGMALELIESKGPTFAKPIRTAGDIDSLLRPNPNDELKFVMDALSVTKRELNGRVPLIGFAGAPWTLFSYMVEGSGSRNFSFAKTMIYDSPEVAHRLLKKLAEATTDYLAAQFEAGADAVQLFDTWAGILPANKLEEFSLSYITQIVGELKRYDKPVIVFAKDCGQSLERIVDTGCDVVGVDWRTDIADARAELGDRVALQGNMDPTMLFASEDCIRAEARSILQRFGAGEGHIFNLGHGILPGVPVANAKALVDAVKKESPRFHTLVGPDVTAGS